MVEPPDVGGDVVAGGAALAGFILVYLGLIETAFSAYDPTQQSAVVSRFRRRAWTSVIGILLALAAIGLGLVGKWQSSPKVVSAGVIVLLATLVGSAWVAVAIALDVRA